MEDLLWYYLVGLIRQGWEPPKDALFTTVTLAKTKYDQKDRFEVELLELQELKSLGIKLEMLAYIGSVCYAFYLGCKHESCNLTNESHSIQLDPIWSWSNHVAVVDRLIVVP